MSAIGAWILSILGIVIIGAVIDLVLPSGRMNKYVKSIFAAVTVLVIIMPLPTLFKNGCRSDGFIIGGDINLDESYLENMRAVKKASLINGLKSALSDDGIIIGEIYIDGDFDSAVPVITGVKINLNQVVIVGQSEHINKYELILEKLTKYLTVDKDVIVIYER